MRVIAIDTETETFKPGDMIPRLVSFAWADSEHPTGVLLHHSECLDTFQVLLTDPDVLLVGQFIAYDMAALMRHAPELTQLIFAAYDADRVSDTKLRDQLLAIRSGGFAKGNKFSLADLAARWLNIDLAKGEDTWRMRYGELRDTPVDAWPEDAREYALRDAETTLKVWQAQETYGPGPIVDEFAQARASFWLHLCATRGLWIDESRRDALLARLGGEEAELIARLQAIGLVRADGTRNVKAVRQKLTEAGSRAKTRKGALKTDAESCSATGHPDLVAYGRLGEVRSARSAFSKLLAVNPVHTRYDMAITGRTTSGGEDSPGNLQNLPRTGGVRECFVPRPGHVFANADFDGLELRTMAQVCLDRVGSSTLAEELNSGRDPHTEMAAKICMATLDSFSPSSPTPRGKCMATLEARQLAKGLNFGLPGGMGATRLQSHLKTYGQSVTLDEASRLAGIWRASRPEFTRYFELADEPGDLIHVGSGRVRGGNIPYTEYCNALFQGLGADAAKRAGWLVTRACWAEPDSPLYGSRVVLFAHDEFLLEVPIDKASSGAPELSRLMCAGADEFLPDVPAKTTPLLSTCYSKEAKALYDAAGELIPWSPPSDRPGTEDGLGPIREPNLDPVRVDIGEGSGGSPDSGGGSGGDREPTHTSTPSAPPGPDHPSDTRGPDSGPVPWGGPGAAGELEGSDAQGRVLEARGGAPGRGGASSGEDGLEHEGRGGAGPLVLEAALEYAAFGFPVFPCREKEPATEHGFRDATRDEAQIRKWFKT